MGKGVSPNILAEQEDVCQKMGNFYFFIYLLVMPKYWGKQIFTHGSFPEVGQKQKTKKERERERKTESC